MIRSSNIIPKPRKIREKVLRADDLGLEGKSKLITDNLIINLRVVKKIPEYTKSDKKVKPKIEVSKVIEVKDKKEVYTYNDKQEESKVINSKAINILKSPQRFVKKSEKLKEFKISVEETRKVISNKNVSLIIGIKGLERLKGLIHVLESIKKQSVKTKIILVEQDESSVYKNHVESLVDKYLFTYSDRLYNRSWAFNCGSLLTDDEFIILHDCDLIAPEDYVEKSLKIIGDKDFGFGWYQINYLTESSSRNYPDGNLEFKGSFLNKQTVGGSEIIRNDFYKDIGGMDERFEGWGGEDNVFHYKACCLGKMAWDSTNSGSHLIHYYHDGGNRNHNHGHINRDVIGEYYKGDRSKLRERISRLPSIGYPNRFGDSFLVDNTLQENVK